MNQYLPNNYDNFDNNSTQLYQFWWLQYTRFTISPQWRGRVGDHIKFVAADTRVRVLGIIREKNKKKLFELNLPALLLKKNLRLKCVFD